MLASVSIFHALTSVWREVTEREFHPNLEWEVDQLQQWAEKEELHQEWLVLQQMLGVLVLIEWEFHAHWMKLPSAQVD